MGLTHETSLYICDRVDPPEYYSPALGRPIPFAFLVSDEVFCVCKLLVDLRKLWATCVTKRQGPKDEYIQVEYELGIKFDSAEIEFSLLHEGLTVDCFEINYT